MKEEKKVVKKLAACTSTRSQPKRKCPAYVAAAQNLLFFDNFLFLSLKSLPDQTRQPPPDERFFLAPDLVNPKKSPTFVKPKRQTPLEKREISSAGSEHLPYKQRVTGSNPVSPTIE